MKIDNREIPVRQYETVIVGSGAAAYAAADELIHLGYLKFAMITENRMAGTSRNAGSDKQTYYKLSLAGDSDDSVEKMVQSLMEGGGVDGDMALCEAALSSRCFYRLAELGVPFPVNGYGEYVGYQTDHDSTNRATSSGPYTSKNMTEALEKYVLDTGIAYADHMQVIRILTDQNVVKGLLCLNLMDGGYTIFKCSNLIYGVGGPAGIYMDSAYPESQYGASGLAFEAGVKGKNLTEWQYGMASVNPRWNVSGSYMQVIPRFVSLARDGGDEREFLRETFTNEGDMLTKIFMKGYQWPFDVNKLETGSSAIDYLVYQENLKGRKVFLDYRSNSGMKDFDVTCLSAEASRYLKNNNACFGVPFDRLKHMNEPAVDYYMEHGIDLSKEMLEIKVCAQHNNGGLTSDCWWRTNVDGLYAVGEVNGSHGVTRPGGSALNAGQAGARRAAQQIVQSTRRESCCGGDYMDAVISQIQETVSLESLCRSTVSNVKVRCDRMRKRMSCCGALIREKETMEVLKEDVREEYKNFHSTVKYNSKEDLMWIYRYRDILISQFVYLYAMLDYAETAGCRGSALYVPYYLDQGCHNHRVQEVEFQADDLQCKAVWRDVRGIPLRNETFEQIWKAYRSHWS